MAADTVTLPESVEDLLERLGGIPGSRVLMSPPPGQATEADLLDAMAKYDRLYELVDGTLVEKAMGMNESLLAGMILRRIGNFAEDHDLGLPSAPDGPIRMLTSLVRMPDVSFFSWHQFPGRVWPTERVPKLIPELAVEVLSDSNTPAEMQRKRKEYFLAGTRLMWVIDPVKRNAKVYTKPAEPDETIGQDGALDGGDVLPGFTLPLAPLFAHLPPEKKPRRKKKA